MSGTLGLFASPRDNKKREARRARLAVEQLEERLALSWTGVPPSVISLAGATRVVLNSQGNQNGNASIASTEVDLYYFDASTTGVYRFSASTPYSSLDTVLGVFNSAGQRLAFNDDIAVGNYDSQVTISLTAGQRYYFGITNYTGSPGGSYSWYVDGPQPILDDVHEDNDSFSQAIDLGTLASTRTLNNLVMADLGDYFRFRLSAAGASTSYVFIDFSNAQGNLNLALHNVSGTLLRTSLGTVDDERISLNGLVAGTYYVRVYGYMGARNPSYSLTIDPAVNLATGNRVLYLNFDGANISRSDLVRWAGSDWSGTVNTFDADRNGISVQAFLRNRSDRETIINRMMTLIREDVSPFGITVQRTTGLAVEGVGATTIFLGVSTLSNGYYHVAADVDFGNNNRTDIAFVGDENWGAVERTALAMADVTLHEAGHTYGLYHVNSGTYPETMGLRYSNDDQSLWAVNTSFMNRTFAEFVDEYGPHGGGRGPQNSYQTMANAFGLVSGGGGSGPAGSPARSPSDAEHTPGCCCPVCSAAGRTSIDKYQFIDAEQPARPKMPLVVALADTPARPLGEKEPDGWRAFAATTNVRAHQSSGMAKRAWHASAQIARAVMQPTSEETLLLKNSTDDAFTDLAWLKL